MYYVIYVGMKTLCNYNVSLLYKYDNYSFLFITIGRNEMMYEQISSLHIFKRIPKHGSYFNLSKITHKVTGIVNQQKTDNLAREAISFGNRTISQSHNAPVLYPTMHDLSGNFYVFVLNAAL